MSALPHRGTHVRELFANQSGPNLGMGSFEVEVDQKESRKSYDMGASKKKRRAPAPPVSSGLGQYKPRILSDDSVTNVPINHAMENPVRPPRPSKYKSSTDNHVDNSSTTTSNNNNDVSKPFIMGDKDTPLVLHPSPDPHDLDLPVGDLTLTSDGAPLTLNSEGMPGRGEDSLGTENPLFQMQEEESEAVIDFDDPAEEVTHVTETPHLNGVMHFDEDDDDDDKNHHDDHRIVENGEPEGVYIPAPDYDEEEKTMVFDDEDDAGGSPRRNQKVFKEYYGEDFAQYLSDEETVPQRVPIRPKRTHHNVVVDRKSKTEVKRPHYKKRDALPSKGKKDKSFSGSNSLRDFSFADSKFGTISGVKKRHSMPSLSEDEAELFVNTGESYEQFLRMKNGEDVGDVFTDPSFGEGTGMGGGGHHHHQIPSRYTRPSNNKDTLWKKLTWRFKKQSRRSVDLS